MTTSRLLYVLCMGAMVFRAAAGTPPSEHPAGPIVDAVAKTRTDIEAQKKALAATYERIREARLTAVGAVAKQQTAITELESELAEKKAASRDLDGAITTLHEDIEHIKKLSDYMRVVALDYRQAFETTLPPGDAERLVEPLSQIDALLGEAEKSGETTPIAPLLELSIAHVDELIGGTTYPGNALDQDGTEHQGTFLRYGPVSYFESNGKDLRGITIQQIGSSLPTVFTEFPPPQAEGVTQLFEAGEGTVPFDVTQGAAVQITRVQETWQEHLAKGGVTMIPLLGLAVVCIGMSVIKLFSLVLLAGARSRSRVAEVVTALRDGDTATAETIAKRLKKPLGPVIRMGIEYRDTGKEHLEEILYEQIISQVPGLERFLTPLSVCASAAPLLGLLGTVTGMIHTFRLITVFGTGDAKLLSSGISEALITTEVGLMIAIPALLIHAYLARRVRRIIAMTHEMAVSFVNGIKLRGNEQA